MSNGIENSIIMLFSLSNPQERKWQERRKIKTQNLEQLNRMTIVCYT